MRVGGGAVVVFLKRCGIALCAGVLWLAIGLLQPAAAASVQIDPRYQSAYDAAFHATYDHPDDVGAALTFAKIAAVAGDLEGAIGALERVLIYNPAIPEVDLELGLLYKALGSYAAAQVYLQRADPAKLSPADQATRAEALATVDAGLARNKLSGVASLGLRYQTNANAGPIAASQAAGGPPAATPGTAAPAIPPISRSERARADTDAFAAIAARDSYDLGDQAGTTWDSRLTLYGTRQFHRHLDNVALAELDTGPRFRLAGPESNSPTLRPYVVGNVFELGGSEYYASGGGGLSLGVQLDPQWSFEGTFEARDLRFSNSSVEPTATDYDAVQVLGRLLVNYAPTVDDLASLLAQFTNYDAKQGFYTYQEARLGAGYIHRFPAPWSWRPQPWSVGLFASYAARPYDHRDASVDPVHLRDDNEWTVSGALTIGLLDQVDFRLEVQQVWADSTVALYEYRDTAVLGSIGLRF